MQNDSLWAILGVVDHYLTSFWGLGSISPCFFKPVGWVEMLAVAISPLAKLRTAGRQSGAQTAGYMMDGRCLGQRYELKRKKRRGMIH